MCDFLANFLKKKKGYYEAENINLKKNTSYSATPACYKHAEQSCKFGSRGS
jgi:hypothetical protein